MQGISAKILQGQNGNPSGYTTALSTTFLPSQNSKTVRPVKPQQERLLQDNTNYEAIKVLKAVVPAVKVVDDATTIATSIKNGPEHAHDAFGNGKNRLEITESGMNLAFTITPIPKVAKAKINAAEFSALNKGSEILSNKSEISTAIKQNNIATVDASQAIEQAKQAKEAANTIGNLKQQIDTDRKKMKISIKITLILLGLVLLLTILKNYQDNKADRVKNQIDGYYKIANEKIELKDYKAAERNL